MPHLGTCSNLSLFSTFLHDMPMSEFSQVLSIIRCSLFYFLKIVIFSSGWNFLIFLQIRGWNFSWLFLDYREDYALLFHWDGFYCILEIFNMQKYILQNLSLGYILTYSLNFGHFNLSKAFLIKERVCRFPIFMFNLALPVLFFGGAIFHSLVNML